MREFIGRTLGETLGKAPLLRMPRGPGYAVGLERWVELTPLAVSPGQRPSVVAAGRSSVRR
ncbi:hypothetical protein GALL_335800 [mine drainage metagenome]|uniref:Uncharacterized protein n=1 Tax=mine drainage metagenome TaxID=410659 RepID=A0A1J5R4E8_9ZZZZ